MTPYLPTLLLLTTMAAEVLAQNEDAFYKLGPDSMRQEGVAQGKLLGPLNLPCNVFPGTSHTYWVYVPAQYDPKTPAGLMIFNDGQAFVDREGECGCRM